MGLAILAIVIGGILGQADSECRDSSQEKERKQKKSHRRHSDYDDYAWFHDHGQSV